MAKSPDETIRDMMAGLESKTGKDLAGWKLVLDASGLKKHGEMVSYLKSDHGLGHGYANMIVHMAQESHAGAMQDVDLIAEVYAGKPALREIHDVLIDKINSFGTDIEHSPKKAYLSLRRAKQFATIGPGSKTRLDVCIQLKGVEPVGRLETVSGGMTTHRVKVTSLSEVDAELIGWLKQAYEAAK